MDISQTTGISHQILGLETAPHLKAKMTTQKIMALVFICLMPAFFIQIYYFGFGIVFQFINCAITALICELVVAFLRKRSLIKATFEISYLVTALIMALTLPPLLPVYFTVVATIFAMIVGKAVFGGLGNNIFNPAMLGFIFIVISAPQAMAPSWVAPAPDAYMVATLNQSSNVIYGGADSELLKKKIDELLHAPVVQEDLTTDPFTITKTEPTHLVDAYSGATFLEKIKSDRKEGSLTRLLPHSFEEPQYKAYLALAIAYLAGGIVLMLFKIIFFKMVLTFFVAYIALTALMHHIMPGYFLAPLDNLLFGGVMIGAFFIMTDPTTASGTAHGRIYFAILYAVLLVFLRAFGSYSDAVAFAILLSNACAPLIDVLAHRRPYGVGYKKGGMK